MPTENSLKLQLNMEAEEGERRSKEELSLYDFELLLHYTSHSHMRNFDGIIHVTTDRYVLVDLHHSLLGMCFVGLFLFLIFRWLHFILAHLIQLGKVGFSDHQLSVHRLVYKSDIFITSIPESHIHIHLKRLGRNTHIDDEIEYL